MQVRRPPLRSQVTFHAEALSCGRNDDHDLTNSFASGVRDMLPLMAGAERKGTHFCSQLLRRAVPAAITVLAARPTSTLTLVCSCSTDRDCLLDLLECAWCVFFELPSCQRLIADFDSVEIRTVRKPELARRLIQAC